MENLAALKVKANAHYTCQECGSTELIQAHHELPSDDNSLMALCADCHSQRHPDIPKALFFSKRLQRYWHNKSASSIAKELRVSSRTVIRAARKLQIAPCGDLSPEDEQLLKTNTVKYDSMRKLKRDKELQRYAEANPGISLREIAEVYGITRQRVCQILAKANRQKAANPTTDNSKKQEGCGG